MKLMSLLVACGLAAAVTAQGGPDDVLDPLLNATLPPEQVFTTVACDVDNCESCFETDICQTCESGYSANHSLATTGTCSKCGVDDCDMCDDDVDSCSQCKVGFSLSSTTTSDDDGNDVVVNSCTACEISDCGDCSIDDDGAEVCNACMEGFYMFDGGCAACGDNCAQCADVDASGNVGGCLVCDDTYEPEIDGSCLLIGTDCGSHCLECEEHNDCKTCEDGYSVMLYNNGESTGCAPCPSNCASCTDANTCDVCEDGFIMDEISGSCATQAQVYANVCDCRVSLNGGCTCVGDEDTSKDGCCDLGGMCDPDNADGVCATYSAGCDAFENCAYCFGQSFCGECDSGYYKTEGRAWGACIALPSGWDLELCGIDTLYDNQCSCGCGGVDPECVDHTVENCDGDQVYCDADGACAECAIEGCAFCANGDAGTDTCSECMDGYDLNEDNTCTECDIDGCSSCSTGLSYDPETDTATEVTTCRTCMAGYFEDLETGACSQCDIANCEMCTGGECNNCLEGYSLQDDGSCDSCGDNCLQCGQSQCNRCATGYEIKDGSCQKTGQDCGDNCQVCQRGGQCKICDAGFYVGAGTNGKCVSCMSNCASCRDASSCTVCEEGYSYDINEFACLPAGDCLADICDCREDTNSGCTCLEDEDSAKLGCCNSDCGKCGDLCADFNNEPCTDFDNCEYCFEQTYCMECAENYYQPEYHGDCVALPEGWNVQDCPVDMLNNNVCDCSCGGYDPECDEWPAEDCASGEYCSSQAECLECSLAGCAHCSNGDGHIDGTCLECTDGHYQDEDGNCNNCDLVGCKECLLLQGEDGDTFSCKECSDGYYMNTEDTCAVCAVDNCESCNLEGDCETCETGFSLDAGVCSGCIENCLDCTGDTTTCKRCDDNYEVVEEDGTCGSTGNDCGDNCQVCGAQGICKQCLSTYFKDTDSSCQECMDNCGACSNGESCNDCVSGYGYVPERTACEAYSDPIDYCDAAIASGDLAEGSECECSGWECSEVSSRTLRLRRD